MATITPAQLQAVLDGCNQLSLTIEQIRELAEIIQLGKLAGVSLDQTMTDNLVARYSILKAQLQTQFGSLP